MNSRHKHKSRRPSQTSTLSNREVRILNQLQQIAIDHQSGGSFNMVCVAVKGNGRMYGFNKLKRKATTIDESYPELAGQHAELDVYSRYRDALRGTTVFVAGSHAKNGNPLSTTRCCKYCSAILDAAEVKAVIYLQDSIPVKTSPKQLL